jgi:hypothetical protein
LIRRLNGLLQILAGRAMNQEHTCGSADFPLTNQASIEANAISGSNPDAKNRRLVVYGDAPCAYPVFYFTARPNAGAGQHFLKALAIIAGFTPLDAVLLLLGLVPQLHFVVIVLLPGLAILLFRRFAPTAFAGVSAAPNTAGVTARSTLTRLPTRGRPASSWS